MRVGISLLACNRADEPRHYRAMRYAIASLLDSDLLRYDWRIQVVDNGSADGVTADFLQGLADRWERIDVRFAGENLGIAHGRNLAYQLLAESHAPDVVVEVHTDHLFPTVWLTPLIKALEADRTLGIVGPALLSGRSLGWALEQVPLTYDETFKEARALVSAAAENHRQPGRVVPGLTHPAAIRWAMVEALNERDDEGRLCLYDPRMPGKQNFEDTELLYRAHMKNWKAAICFGSVVFHHYTFSRTQVVSDHHADYKANRVYCQRKHGAGFEEYQAELGAWMDSAYSSEGARV